MNRLKQLFSSFGPAIIVAAIVLGPGSILTSSKAGAQYGYVGIAAIVLAVVLMIAMVALAGRIGVIYQDSPCDQLARRLGRPVAVIVGGDSLWARGNFSIFQQCCDCFGARAFV